LTFRWHSILALVLSASTALAGWDGFPCPSNASWYAVETNHYWAQLMTGLTERCKASGVSAPAIVDTYTSLFAGYTNTYTTITNGDVFVITNNWICYTNVTVTNQFLPFAYSWSQTNGTSGTATCYPAVKQSWIAAWDSKFASIIGGPWVRVEDCGLLSNATADSYFSAFGTNSGADFPVWTRTNLFARYGIGSGTNGGGLFTHTPELLTNEWVLGAVRKTTNSATSWSYKEMTPITTTIYDQSIRPVFEYWPSCPTNQTLATSFGGSSVVFTVTGTILNFASQTATSGTEVVTISDSNAVATVHPWYRITGIACTNAPPNSNDAWRVVYRDSFPIYGGNPYRLYACDINERQAALDPLVCTRYQLTLGTSYKPDHKKYGDNGFAGGVWATEVAEAQADYSPPSEASESNNYNLCVGSIAYYDGSGYQILIVGNSTTNFSWPNPSTMASTEFVATPYISLFPMVWNVGEALAGSTNGYTNRIYDAFGLYTNINPFTLSSIQSFPVTGSSYAGWTIGSTNIPSPVCNQPPTAGAPLPVELRETRGYTWRSDVSGYAFWMQAMHTNWMTKW
jgi:hypothetical protein